MSVVTLPSMPKLRSMLPSALKRARMKSAKVPPTMTILPSACSAMPERSPPKRSSVALPAVPKVVSMPVGSDSGGGRSSSRIVSTAVVCAPSAAQPPGCDSVRLTVLFGSTTWSTMIGTLDDSRRRVAVSEEHASLFTAV